MATDTMPRTPRTAPGRSPYPETPRTGKVTAPRHTRPATRPAAAPRPGSRTSLPPRPAEQQTLTNEVAQAGNPAVIASKAEQLGMRPNPHLGFLDPKTGRIIVGKPSRAEKAINVPGYTP